MTKSCPKTVTLALRLAHGNFFAEPSVLFLFSFFVLSSLSFFLPLMGLPPSLLSFRSCVSCLFACLVVCCPSLFSFVLISLLALFLAFCVIIAGCPCVLAFFLSFFLAYLLALCLLLFLAFLLVLLASFRAVADQGLRCGLPQHLFGRKGCLGHCLLACLLSFGLGGSGVGCASVLASCLLALFRAPRAYGFSWSVSSACRKAGCLQTSQRGHKKNMAMVHSPTARAA